MVHAVGRLGPIPREFQRRRRHCDLRCRDLRVQRHHSFHLPTHNFYPLPRPDHAGQLGRIQLAHVIGGSRDVHFSLQPEAVALTALEVGERADVLLLLQNHRTRHQQRGNVHHTLFAQPPQGSVLTLIPLSSHHLIARSPLAPLLLRQVLQAQQRRVFVGAWPQRTGCLTVQQTLG